MSNPVSYEPSRPSEQRSCKKKYKNENVKNLQREVDGVVDVMRSNVLKIVERGEKLEELDERANSLNDSANEFQKTAQKVKKKFWWKNLKMTLILASIVIVIIIIIIVSTVGFPKSEDHSHKELEDLIQRNPLQNNTDSDNMVGKPVN